MKLFSNNNTMRLTYVLTSKTYIEQILVFCIFFIYLLLHNNYLIVFSAALAVILITVMFCSSAFFYLGCCLMFIQWVRLYIPYENALIRVYPWYVFFILIIILSPLIIYIRNIKKYNTNSLHSIFILYMIIEFISISWTDYTKTTDLYFDYAALIGVAIVTPLFINSFKDIRRILIAFIIIGITCSAAVILSKYYSFLYEGHLGIFTYYCKFGTWVKRPAGFNHPSAMAGYINIAILSLLYFLTFPSSLLQRFGQFILLGILIAGLALTQARASLIATFIGAGFYLYFFKTSHTSKKFFVISLLLFSIIVSLSVKPELIDRFLVGFGYQGELVVSGGSYSSAGTSGADGISQRLDWWSKITQYMINNPAYLIFGAGYGISWKINSESPHSSLLSFFFHIGFIGIIFLTTISYLIFNYMHIALNKKISPDKYNALLSICASLISAVMIQGMVDIVFQFLYGILVLTTFTSSYNILARDSTTPALYSKTLNIEHDSFG